MPDADARALDVQPITRLFKALGDETRLRIVALLSHGELCVCHVESALGLAQPTASRQLAVLRNAGVVSQRRVGSWVYYRLARLGDPDSHDQLRRLVRSFKNRKLLGEDLKRLVKSRGPGACR